MGKKVFILDGSQKSSLAVLRSLGRKGIECDVGEYFTPNLCTNSKYCGGKIKYPSPMVEPKKFKQFLLEYIQKNELYSIFPMTDTTIPLSLEAIEKSGLDHLISYIDKEKYLMASDKFYLITLAKHLSVPYPQTFIVKETSDLLKVADYIDYPVVIKPAKSKVSFNDKIVSLNVSYANNPKQLMDILKLGLRYKIIYMVQKFIKGEGIGFFCLYQNGKAKRIFYHKRILEKPPSGGVSVLCESMREDLMIKKYATKLLDELKWHGVAMVEFKKEFKTGIPYLMEINARFWGSLELAIRSGVDFPYETFNMICGNALTNENKNYIDGIRCSWITGIFDHFYLLMKDKKFNEVMYSFKKIACTRKKTYDFVLVKDDFKPFFYETFQNIKNAF